MKIRVITSKNFRIKAKRLLKKYNSLKSELQDLEKQLYENPEFGISLGNSCYKIKVSVKSKGKGKSSRVRIITNIVIRISQKEENTKIVGMVTIFDKSEYENISDHEIKLLLSELDDELRHIENV